MIKIKNVEIKQTKTGKEYKALTLDNDININMWSNDIDYSIANEGAELDRHYEKQWKWYNLLEKVQTPSESKNLSDSEVAIKFEILFTSLKRIEEKLGLDSLENQIRNKQAEAESNDDTIPVDEDGVIDPTQIPF